MGKRKCVFNENLQKEYPFLKKTNVNQLNLDHSKVQCSLCHGVFSVEHGGKSDIKDHIKSKKHKDAITAKAVSQKVNDYFGNEKMASADAKLAAAEGTLAYHTAYHNHSFRSMDCTSTIVKKMFDQKFTCARTKAESIVVNVFAPFAMVQIVNELKNAKYVSVLVDGSNHKNIKLIPVMLRYFIPNEGIKTKVIEFSNLPGETSDLISAHILKVLNRYHLTEKIIAFSADNTNTNFGGAARRGTNNVYTKLCGEVKRQVVGVGCAAHILHNSVQTAADCLPIDVECIVSKIYQYFYIYTVRVAKLEDFCKFVDINYQTILGHSKTRWLSLSPAVERIIAMYDGLKSFFLSEDKCPVILKNFFNNPNGLLLMNWLYCQLELYNTTIKRMEAQDISATEITSEIGIFINKLNARKEEFFLTEKVRLLISQVEEEGEKGHLTMLEFRKLCSTFYTDAVDYIEKWAAPYNEFSDISWVLLKKIPAWEDVVLSLNYVKKIMKVTNIDENQLFDEYGYVKQYVLPDKIRTWVSEKVPTVTRWLEITNHFKDSDVPCGNILQIVEFTLALPGTNAAIERIFSLVNALWTDEKNRLDVATVGALLTVKTHFEMNCSDFHNFLLQNNKILEEIHSAQKYAKSKLEDTVHPTEAAGPSTSGTARTAPF